MCTGCLKENPERFEHVPFQLQKKTILKLRSYSFK